MVRVEIMVNFGSQIASAGHLSTRRLGEPQLNFRSNKLCGICKGVTTGVDDMNGSRSDAGNAGTPNGVGAPKESSAEKGSTKRIGRRRLIITSVAATPILMTLGVNARVAQADPHHKDPPLNSGITSGHSSIIHRHS